MERKARPVGCAQIIKKQNLKLITGSYGNGLLEWLKNDELLYAQRGVYKEGTGINPKQDRNIWRYDPVNFTNLATINPATSPVITYLYGEIKRGIDGNYYIPNMGQPVEKVRAYDGSVWNSSSVLNSLSDTAKYKLTSSLPTQVFKIFDASTLDLNNIKRTVGDKSYELKDHLGNVRVVISDAKLIESVSTNSAIVDNTDNFFPEVLSFTDFFPFGQPLPGRMFNASSYRYGFNGKENDNEAKGSGNQQDYGMRIYDPRLGRFLSVDPLTKEYPWYTPYQFAGNKPIAFVDRDGEEEARPDEISAAILRPYTAYKVNQNKNVAFNKAQNSGLPNPRDGQQDAFRHALWNALNARDVGEKSAEFFPTLHETGSDANNPKSEEYDPVAIEMDLFNNDIGRKIGAANPDASNDEMAGLVLSALNSGELKVVKIGTPGGVTQTPVTKDNQPIQNNTEKVLINSADKKTDSGATKAKGKDYTGGTKKAEEYKTDEGKPTFKDK